MMSGFVSVDGVMGWIIIALPLLVFVGVACWALRALGRREHRKERDDCSALTLTELGRVPGAAEPRLGKPLREDTDDSSRGRDPNLIPNLKRRIEDEKRKIESSELARLYIELGRELRELGERQKAGVALREGLGVSIRLKLKGEQARSRLEMAEVMVDGGDLVAACEQWQIARELFVEENQTEVSKEIDEKMRKTGCPTDWVLSDF